MYISDYKVITGGQNRDCLNTIRLLAAIEVLYGHTLAHLEIGSIAVFNEFIRFFSGVPIFFTMSGFLIWWSVGRSHSYGEYLKKRFWRIYPELWLAVLVELVVLLALYHQPINWPQFGLFAITQSTIFQFWTPDCLRGYGCGCPNGSLWTICVLIQFYIFAYFFYKWLHGKKLWVWVVAILGSLGLSLLTPAVRSFIPEIAGKLYGQTLIPYLWMFLCAALVAEKKDVMIPFLKKYWWAFVAALLLKKYLLHWDIQASYSVFGTLLLFLGLVGFAYSFPKLNIKTDISYGIYIYHMTVVNALMTFGLFHNPWLFVLVLVATCLLAWISTKTVGAWAGRMKVRKVNG